ncbi:MaoC family dehydratase N-terminal domain-containing protein [Chloroflexota bacterium]
MVDKKWTYQLEPGENLEPLEFTVTPEFNQQYLEAIEDWHPRYHKTTNAGPPIVHPALLVNYSNIIKPPSFKLPIGMAAVHSHEEIEFHNPGRVGDTFRVTWKVIDVYEKRGRMYQVKEALIVNKKNLPIIKRKLTDTYISGKG